MAWVKVPAEELRRLRRVQELKRKRRAANPAGSDDVNNGDDVCAICDNGGDLTCCDGICKRSFHLDESESSSCRRALGLTKAEAQAIVGNREAGFVCKNCEYGRHQCFACGRLGSSDASSPEVFQCAQDDDGCGRFYHPKCVARLLYWDGEAAALFEHEVAAGLGFVCPAHECCVCRGAEDRGVERMQFAVCRRCPTVYHRKCLPEEILFKTKRNGPMKRAWDDLLTDRILIFCMKHDIVRKLRTPSRDHIVFPDAEEHGATTKETPQDSPVKQEVVSESEGEDQRMDWHPFPEPSSDRPRQFPASKKNHDIVKKLRTPARDHVVFRDAEEPVLGATTKKKPQASPVKQEVVWEEEEQRMDWHPFTEPPSEPPRQVAASNKNHQCICSGHMDSFAPKALFMHPQPGSCGWIDDDDE